ncbi:MAG: class I adenylate-forming enzyme family protein [Sphingomonas sp.]|uniref:class I adenylate-forming enzyme family protein n=1 Tax=Sphingomonas sp. TaxID=28214 RepID=UPI003569F1B5
MEAATSSVGERRAAMERRHPLWVPMTLDRYLENAVADFTDRPLVITDDGIMSYAQVDAAATRIAQMLRNRGVKPGDRVAMLMANFPITVALLFGIWRAEATAVPLNTLYRPDELGFVLRQSAPRLLIAMTRFLKRDFASEIPAVLPGGTDLLLYDPDAPAACDLVAAIDAVSTIADGDLADATRIPAVIMYTSGTTGSPKGVILSHDNLLRAAYAGAHHQAFEDGRRAIFSVPLYHGFGLVVGLLSGIVVGGSIVPLPRFDARAMLTGIARHRATYLMGVPTMTVAMLELAEQESFDLSSLTAIHSAAAPTPSWVWRRIQEVFGCGEVFTSYGQTEATATIICTQPGDPIDVVATTQGIIVKGGVSGIPACGGDIAEFRIVDPDSGVDSPPGIAGEIWTRGPMNSLGYLDRPADTAALFAEGGWLRTGDRGYFREDGNLLLTGRTKELFKSRGELVSPKEIEEVITTHPAVREAYVIGMPDERDGECGCAWLVAAGPIAPSVAEVNDFLASRLPRFKMPRDIWFIDPAELPKTSTGKVQKNLLKDRAERLLAAGVAA